MKPPIEVYGTVAKYQPHERGDISVSVKVGDTENNRLQLARLHRQGIILSGPYDQPCDDHDHPNQQDMFDPDPEPEPEPDETGDGDYP